MEELVQKRYSSFDGEIGAQIEVTLTLELLPSPYLPPSSSVCVCVFILLMMQLIYVTGW